MNATKVESIDQNADLRVLFEQIKALGPQVEIDATRCAISMDIAGLAFIANTARGLHGASTMRVGLIMDLADYLCGHMPKTVRGRPASISKFV